MGMINDGNTAFPATEAHGLNSGWSGMSLRDYFAAKAMQGFATAEDSTWIDGANGMARCAYHWADAMLKAREQKGAA